MVKLSHIVTRTNFLLGILLIHHGVYFRNWVEIYVGTLMTIVFALYIKRGY